MLSEFGILLNEQEKDQILQALIGNSDRSKPVLNISRLYSIRLASKLRKAYDRVDMYEEADNPNLVDISGYFGLFYREKKQLTPITEAEVLEIIAKNNRLVQIMKVIKDIDIDNNGYVTNQELDDIFKMHYEAELGSKELKPVFKKFASIQNRVLIDYKRMKDYLTKKVFDLQLAESNIKSFIEREVDTVSRLSEMRCAS